MMRGPRVLVRLGFFRDPVSTTAASIDDVPRVVDAPREARRRGLHAALFFGYEAGSAFEPAAADSIGRTRGRKNVRRVVSVVVGVLAALLAGLAWAASSPPGSSPDEDFHLASIWCPPPVESSGCELTQDAVNGTEIVIDRRVVASLTEAAPPSTSSSVPPSGTSMSNVERR